MNDRWDSPAAATIAAGICAVAVGFILILVFGLAHAFPEAFAAVTGAVAAAIWARAGVRGNGFQIKRQGVDESPAQQPMGGDRPTASGALPGGVALVAREGVVFTNLYVKHLVDEFGLTVYTAVNEPQARRILDSHAEISFMLADRRAARAEPEAPVIRGAGF